MPVRTGYTDSTYHLDTPWNMDGYANDYIYGDSSLVLDFSNDISLIESDGTLDSSYNNNHVLDFSNDIYLVKAADAAVAAQASADSANTLISTLRVQLANAESGGGGAIQTWSS